MTVKLFLFSFEGKAEWGFNNNDNLRCAQEWFLGVIYSRKIKYPMPTTIMKINTAREFPLSIFFSIATPSEIKNLRGGTSIIIFIPTKASGTSTAQSTKNA
jgi:hypothetical protein